MEAFSHITCDDQLSCTHSRPQAWISAFAAVAMDAGANKKAARMRAERVIALMQGSLVLSRGLGTPQPFRDFLKSAPAELL